MAFTMQNRFRSLATGVLAVAAAAVTAGIVWLSHNRTTPVTIPVLMYHRISDERTDNVWWVLPEDFRRQMAFLEAEGYRTILPADLAANRRWGRPLPPRPILLTFDDGYLSNLTVVEPVLKEHGFRGVVFLITGIIAEDAGERTRFEGSPLLTWQEIREIHRRGVLTFGGHSRTHRNLASFRNPIPEIRGCYEDIVRNGGFKPDGFCYPGGSMRRDKAWCARASGYTTAFLCEDRVATIRTEDDLLAIPRVSVYGGRHAFSVRRVDVPAAPDAVVFRVREEGVPVDVVPHLVGDGVSIWLDRVRIGSGEVELRAHLPEAVHPGEDLRLEFWDVHRVLRLSDPLGGSA